MMKVTHEKACLALLILLPILAVGVAIVMAVGRPNRWIPGSEKGQQVEAQQVPLESIYSTSRQEGLKVVDQGAGDQAFPIQMREVYQQSIKMGASNVFLARGDDIAAAVHATWEVFTRRQSAVRPVNADRRSKSEKHWLVAYLGVAGSEPPAWLVSSAVVSGKEIRVSYTTPGSSATDLHPFFVWIPVGRLEPGTYTLELFDEERRQVTLLRRVELPAK